MAQLMSVAVNYRWVAKNPSLASGGDIIVDANSLVVWYRVRNGRVLREFNYNGKELEKVK